MSGAAAVKIKEIDQSTRVPGFEGVFGAICIPAKKGPTDAPYLITNDTQFLSVFTPEETVKVGYDLSHYSALAFLEKSNSLWVQRVVNNAFYAGASVKDEDGSDNQALPSDQELADPTAYVFDSNVDVEEKAEITAIECVADVDASLDAEGVILFDDVGSVAFWIDVDNSGTTIPAWASDADRAIEVTTIAEDDDALTVASKLAVAINADSKFSAIASDDVVAVTDASAGAREDATSAVFGIEVIQQGVTGVDEEDEVLLIHGSSEGAFGNDIGFKLFNYTDYPDVVIEEGAFILEIYHRNNQATPLERFLCSRIEGKKDGYGRNIFVEDVLEASNYVGAKNNGLIDENILPKSQSTILFLAGGSDGSAVTDSNMISAADKFSNPDEISVTLLMDGGYTIPAYQQKLTSIAQNRMDCVAILSMSYAAENSSSYMNEILDYRKTSLNLNSSYAALYTPHLYIADRFNDRYIFVSPDGYVAATISETGSNYELWYPAAGFRRGILNVSDVKIKFTQGEMDTLYNNGINMVRFAPGRGIVIWGQKTLSSRPSALDRLNVRLLLIVIEPAIKRALEDFLFELNDDGTRAIVEQLIRSYMDNIKGRRGVEDFRVVCDESNNTPNDIDNNRLIVDLYIKPTRSIEEIPFRVVIVPASLSFDQAAQAL